LKKTENGEKRERHRSESADVGTGVGLIHRKSVMQYRHVIVQKKKLRQKERKKRSKEKNTRRRKRGTGKQFKLKHALVTIEERSRRGRAQPRTQLPKRTKRKVQKYPKRGWGPPSIRR